MTSEFSLLPLVSYRERVSCSRAEKRGRHIEVCINVLIICFELAGCVDALTLSL